MESLVERASAIAKGYIIEERGLIIAKPETMTKDGWIAIGLELVKIEVKAQRELAKVQWALGDWINAHKGSYGETYADAESVTGYKKDYCQALALTAAQYPRSSRKALSFSHHRVAMPLPESEREALLQEAVERRLPVVVIKERVKSYNNELRTPNQAREFKARSAKLKGVDVKCPECKHVFPAKGHLAE